MYRQLVPAFEETGFKWSFSNATCTTVLMTKSWFSTTEKVKMPDSEANNACQSKWARSTEAKLCCASK